MTTLGNRGVLIALVLVPAVASGCIGASSGADKAGGPGGGPVVLRMASTPPYLGDVPPVADFVRRVAALSGGAVRIKVINQWGNYAPDAEVQVVPSLRTS